MIILDVEMLYSFMCPPIHSPKSGGLEKVVEHVWVGEYPRLSAMSEGRAS